MKITIKTMRHELVLEEVEQIRMMNDRECYNFAADTSGYLEKESYSDDEITELYNNILGG